MLPFIAAVVAGIVTYVYLMHDDENYETVTFNATVIRIDDPFLGRPSMLVEMDNGTRKYLTEVFGEYNLVLEGDSIKVTVTNENMYETVEVVQ